MGNFGRYFAGPTALLEDARIDAHEVHAWQMDRLAIICNCPVNIKRTANNAIVRVAVGIAIIEGLLYPICTFTVGVIGIIRQPRTNKSECGIREPLRKIPLRMEGVFMQIARLVLVVCPTDIGRVGDGVFLIGLRCVGGWCAVVGEGVLVLGGWCSVFATSKLIKWIIRQTILIDINTDHHDAGFATTTFASS